MVELYQLYALERCMNDVLLQLQAQQDLLAGSHVGRHASLERLGANAHRIFEDLEIRREFFSEAFIRSQY